MQKKTQWVIWSDAAGDLEAFDRLSRIAVIHADPTASISCPDARTIERQRALEMQYGQSKIVPTSALKAPAPDLVAGRSAAMTVK